MTALLADYCTRHGVTESDFDRAGIALGKKDTAPLERGLNAVVPVSFAECGDYCAASCFPCLYDAVSAHLHRYRDALFSEDALTALHELLIPHLRAWGYRPSPFAHRFAVSCTADDPGCIPADRILPVTRWLEPGAIPENSLISMNLRDCAVRGAYICTPPEAPDTVCAAASVNRCTQGEACTEIGVECAPAFRRRGYALSCVCALARERIMRGETVLYQYHHTNTASAAVAAKAGLVPQGRFFSYCAFHI